MPLCPLYSPEIGCFLIPYDDVIFGLPINGSPIGSVCPTGISDLTGVHLGVFCTITLCGVFVCGFSGSGLTKILSVPI